MIYNVDGKLLPIIPVKISYAENNKSVIANCLLDTRSDAPIVTKRPTNFLNIKPKLARSVRLCTCNAETVRASYAVDVTMRGIHCSEQFMLNVVVCVDNVATHKNPTKLDKIRITELACMRDVDLPVIENDKIVILIGVDHDKLRHF